MPYLLDIPAKHRWISLKPFIGEVYIAPYLESGKIETVLAGVENYLGTRPLHYEWVKRVHDACAENDVRFIFGQTGNVFIKDGNVILCAVTTCITTYLSYKFITQQYINFLAHNFYYVL